MRPSQLSDVFLAEGVRYTHTRIGWSRSPLPYHAHFPSARRNLYMVQLPLDCLKRAHAIQTRRLTSALMSALVLIRPPRFKFLITCLARCFDDERYDQPETSNMCIVNTNTTMEHHSSSGCALSECKIQGASWIVRSTGLFIATPFGSMV